MGKGLAVTVLGAVMVGCASAGGVERATCGAEWLGREAVITTARGVDERALPIECVEVIGDTRVRVGFSLPAGPSCHVLRRLTLVESAESVSITLVGATDDDPAAGACAPDPRRVVTEIELASPVAGRAVLDGSAAVER